MPEWPGGVGIAAEVAAGRRAAVEFATAALARVDARDAQIRAFLEMTGAHALEQAARVDGDVAARRRVGSLAGVPVAIKDNICTTFGHTTCGSKILAGYVSPYNATVIERIEAAGGVIVGKTNLDEFAMGSAPRRSLGSPNLARGV